MKMAGLLRALGTEVRRSGESPCSTTTKSMGDRQVSETLLTAQLLGAWETGKEQQVETLPTAQWLGAWETGEEQQVETLPTAELLGVWETGKEQRSKLSLQHNCWEHRRQAKNSRKSPDSTTAGSVAKDKSGVLPIVAVPVPGTKCLHRPWPTGHGLPSRVCRTRRETRVTRDGLRHVLIRRRPSHMTRVSHGMCGTLSRAGHGRFHSMGECDYLRF